MRFSYGVMSYCPADKTVGLIRAAEDLGFHGAYLADDPSGRDPWLLLAAAARETHRIRLGVSATQVFLRDPTLIAHALATLDELSAGRAEAVVSYVDPGILAAYHVEWRGKRPLARVREALGVMRAFLDHGEVTHEGESSATRASLPAPGRSRSVCRCSSGRLAARDPSRWQGRWPMACIASATRAQTRSTSSST